MRWPWRKDRRLLRAQREQDEIKSKTRRREELARRAEQHLRKDEDTFASLFYTALGGRP